MVTVGHARDMRGSCAGHARVTRGVARGSGMNSPVLVCVGKTGVNLWFREGG